MRGILREGYVEEVVARLTGLQLVRRRHYSNTGHTVHKPCGQLGRCTDPGVGRSHLRTFLRARARGMLER